jgi:hypothetical protein
MEKPVCVPPMPVSIDEPASQESGKLKSTDHARPACGEIFLFSILLMVTR